MAGFCIQMKVRFYKFGGLMLRYKVNHQVVYIPLSLDVDFSFQNSLIIE